MNEWMQSEPISTKWVEQLALDELNMEESGVVNFNEHLDPAFLLDEASIEFMTELRDRFEVYISKFNEYRNGPNSGASIKIFKISNTVNDFMLFRNSLRLIFSRKASDLITIGFLSSGKDLFAARMSDSEMNGVPAPHEIRAHVGPFNNISWRFAGEVIDQDSLVRHYLSEFIKQSAR